MIHRNSSFIRIVFVITVTTIIFRLKELRYFYSTLYIHLTLDRVYTCETIWVSVCTRAIASYRDSNRSVRVCTRYPRPTHKETAERSAGERGRGRLG